MKSSNLLSFRITPIIFALANILKQEMFHYSNIIVEMSIEVYGMIDYTPFWETLEQSEESWYTLTNTECHIVLCIV